MKIFRKFYYHFISFIVLATVIGILLVLNSDFEFDDKIRYLIMIFAADGLAYLTTTGEVLSEEKWYIGSKRAVNVFKKVATGLFIYFGVTLGGLLLYQGVHNDDGYTITIGAITMPFFFLLSIITYYCLDKIGTTLKQENN